MTTDIVRLSVNLASDTAAALRSIGAKQCTLTHAVRQCISTQTFIDDALERGAKILVEEHDGDVREVLWQ